MEGKAPEQKLFLAFNYVPFGVFAIDSSFTVLFWNRCLEEWTGINQEKIVNTLLFESFPHFNQKVYSNRIQGIFEFGPPVIFSSQLHRHLIPSPLENGEMRIQQTTVTPIPSTDDSEVYALFVIHDVTDETYRIMDYRKMRDRALSEVEERKKAEEALRESEEKFSLHVEQTPLGVIRWNTAFEVTAWNPAAEKIFGYSEKEAIGKHAKDIIVPPSALKYAGKIWDELIRNRGGFSSKNENVTKEGRTIICEWHNTPLSDSKGDVFAVASFVQDITEKDEIEKKIKRHHLEQEILNYLLSCSLEDNSIDKILDLCLEEILSIPFLPLKSTGAIFRAREGARELTLVTYRGLEKEVLDHCISGILFGQCLCGKAAERGETVFAEASDPEHEIRFEGMEPHGHYCVPIKSQKGVLGVITLYLKEGHERQESEVEFLETVAATLAGILERKKVEEALRESEKRYRETINTTSEGYWHIDMEKKTLHVNESLCKMLGYKRDEMLGKTPMDFVDEENAKIFREQTSKIATTPHRIYEISLRKKDGTNVPTIFHATTLKDDKGEPQGGFAFVTDISELKGTEEALRQAKETAEEANRLKDKFVSLVSHDLKNPIHRIAGYFDLIKATQAVSDQGTEMIEEGKIACEDMTTLINEILNMNRIRGGIMHPDYSFIHADEIAGQALRNYATLAREKGISLKNNIPSEFRLYADKRLILEVLRNLISNAIKFCERGDSINILIPPGENSVIAVSDTGVGIEALRIRGLFKYDEKSSTRGTSDEGGSGLGLPLSQDIMVAHCGTLTVSSTSGEGTTFYMNFPHIRPVVMIVDDDESMRALFKLRLENMDVSFIEAGSAEQALAELERSLPHLIFIDMHLTGMTGVELLERIRSTPATEKTPVIVVTVDKSMEAMDSFFQLGADDFISKPFKKDELMSSVRNFIC